MGYIPGFKYDIFISYCHIDNHAPEGEKGWVDHFHEWLESSVVKQFGLGKIEIWRDRELHGNTLFDDQIKKVINSSALFIALTSQHYLDSEYCRKELHWFYNRAQANKYGLSINGQLRLLNVLLRNIHHSQWPSELSGVIGFPMHDAPKNSDELGEPLYHDNVQFRQQLRKIIEAIDLTLNSFQQIFPKKLTQTSDKANIQIFVADVSDTLQNIRDQLIADLQNSPVQIKTDIPPPMINKDHEEIAAKAIANADLSIHLLDVLPGRKIIDLKTTSYPRRQVEIGLDCKTEQFIWIPKDLEYDRIENINYGNFLKSLEFGSRQEQHYEFIRGTKSELGYLIRQKIEQILQAKKDETITPHSVLLDSHQKDQRFAFQLANYLASNGINVEFIKESIKPTLSLQYFEELIKCVSSLVIVFGKVAPNWVFGRVLKIVQIVTEQLQKRNKACLNNCWIYLLPESKTKEIDFIPHFFKIQYLDNRHSESVDPEIVKPLLNSCLDRGRT